MALPNVRQERDQDSFTIDVDNDAARRVVKPTSIETLLNLSTIVGLTSGETFDEIQSGLNLDGQMILEFSLAGACQFQLALTLTSSTVFNILKRPCEGFLLLEDGFGLLQENGDNLLAQGLI